MSTNPLALTKSQSSLKFSLYVLLLCRQSFRCGLFFPDPEKEGVRPVAPLFIFNNSWAADECPGGDTARYNSFCDSIVSLSVTSEPSSFDPL